jgi:hypothetical protein
MTYKNMWFFRKVCGKMFYTPLHPPTPPSRGDLSNQTVTCIPPLKGVRGMFFHSNKQSTPGNFHNSSGRAKNVYSIECCDNSSFENSFARVAKCAICDNMLFCPVLSRSTYESRSGFLPFLAYSSPPSLLSYVPSFP